MERNLALVAIMGELMTSNRASIGQAQTQWLLGSDGFSEQHYQVYCCEETTVLCPKCQSIGKIIGKNQLVTHSLERSSCPFFSLFFNPDIIIDGQEVRCKCPPFSHFVTLRFARCPYLQVSGNIPMLGGKLAASLYQESFDQEKPQTGSATQRSWASLLNPATSPAPEKAEKSVAHVDKVDRKKTKRPRKRKPKEVTYNIPITHFPLTPDEMTKALGVEPKVSVTNHGTDRYLWQPDVNTRIRYESHPEDPGDFNPRHHGVHYHVVVKPNNVSWNQAEKNKLITKIRPDAYQAGHGTGFLPGEKLPGK